jgi:hypothetical protein
MISRGLLTARWVLVAAALAGGASCATGNGTEPDPEFPEDSGKTGDAGFIEDAGKTKDVGETVDTGETVDAGEPDSGALDVPVADVGFDSGVRDVPTADIGFDVGFDSGPRDTGPMDTGPRDTGPIDTGPVDTGPIDTGPRDTGPVDTGPRDTGAPDVPTCVPATEVFNGRDDDCNGIVDEGFSSTGVSLACSGTGRVLVLSDRDIDDGGFSSGGDGLEFYCINGSFRFCLTGEACPWRAGAPAVDNGQSCSSAGLRGSSYFMAYFVTGYFTVGGLRYDEWYCPPTGRVRLSLR